MFSQPMSRECGTCSIGACIHDIVHLFLSFTHNIHHDHELVHSERYDCACVVLSYNVAPGWQDLTK